jgi:AraC-like DNA-binding protein
MQLNEILEEHTIKAISEKTKISEENLHDLLNSNFGTLKKIKTMGFISIIEREYNADLDPLRDEALAYYSVHQDEHNFSVPLPVTEEKKKRSKLFILIVLALLAYASWYFFTQFDKKHLSQLIPFMDEQRIEHSVTEVKENKKEISIEDLSIANVVVSDTNAVAEEKAEDVVPQEPVEHSNDETVKEENASAEPVSQF